MRKTMLGWLAMITTLVAVLGSAASPAAGTPVAGAPAAGVAGASTSLLGLGGVSCVSAKFCAAVGSQFASAAPASTVVPVTMIWNGAGWRKTAMPLPKGQSQGALSSVSCRSAAYCVAIGYVGAGTSFRPLAETWHGSAWTPTTLPKPTAYEGPGYVAGPVSCGAVAHCVGLVGGRGVETLTGGKWTLRAFPLPKDNTGGSVAAVSCVSATYCVLDGVYGKPKGWSVLFESWNGTGFTQLKVSSMPAPNSLMSGVSCTSAKSCVAVGTIWAYAPATVGFAELWNGTAWSLASVKGPENTRLSDVSCSSATRCVAVGSSVVYAANGTVESSQALGLTDAARTWKVASVPALAHGASSEFSTVSCLSASYCVAVGSGGGTGDSPLSRAALTGLWNGKSWKLVWAS